MSENARPQRARVTRPAPGPQAPAHTDAGPASRVHAGIVRETLRSGGRPLPSPARARMESQFGHDFSRVRTHSDAEAHGSAQALNARAYTVGQNIVFGAGEYDPASVSGRQLLAHELTHVVQQSSVGATLPEALALARPGDQSEREADAAADQIMRGKALQIATTPAPAMIAGDWWDTVKNVFSHTKYESGMDDDVKAPGPPGGSLGPGQPAERGGGDDQMPGPFGDPKTIAPPTVYKRKGDVPLPGDPEPAAPAAPQPATPEAPLGPPAPPPIQTWGVPAPPPVQTWGVPAPEE